MNLPDHPCEDELDRLVRQALKERTSSQEPPEYVWRQIRSRLKADAQPPRSRALWLPLAVQSVLTLLLVLLGIIGLQTQVNPGDIHISHGDLLLPVATVYVRERADVAAISEELDRKLLRSFSRARIWNRGGEGNHAVKGLRDVPPNASSPQGRALRSEFSFWDLVIEGKQKLQSGPPPGVN